MSLRAVKASTHPAIKLDLSFGTMPAGHAWIRPTGFDPQQYPWRLKSASVADAYSGYLLQRIPAAERGRFMDELWRVLVPKGTATILVPYWTSVRAIQDPSAEWPPLSENSFLYFNKAFREQNGLEYGFVCDFDFVYGYTFDAATASKSDETRAFWIKHYTNAIADLQVVLTKRG